MKSEKYISELIIHYRYLFSVCCIVFEKLCLFFFQSVKYWKTGPLEQWVDFVHLMARDVQSLLCFFYFPHNIPSWKWKYLCRSHTNNIPPSLAEQLGLHYFWWWLTYPLTSLSSAHENERECWTNCGVLGFVSGRAEPGKGHQGDGQGCVGAHVPVTGRKMMTWGGDSAKSLCGLVPDSPVL